jgi:hypothetical protein
MRTILGLAVAVALIGAVTTLSRIRPQAQEVEDDEPANVSEADVNVYIDVYGAMQSDHDLTIEEALKRHGNGMSLPEFREVERRIQRQDRLVERVRQALLAHAKERAGALQPNSERTKGRDTQP